MEFIKTFGDRRGRVGGIGSACISNGLIKIRINVPNSVCEQVGAIKDGIGVVIRESDKKRKTKYAASCVKYDKEFIPINLQAECYSFSIPAEKISDTEYVFLFKKAKMLNKK